MAVKVTYKLVTPSGARLAADVLYRTTRQAAPPATDGTGAFDVDQDSTVVLVLPAFIDAAGERYWLPDGLSPWVFRTGKHDIDLVDFEYAPRSIDSDPRFFFIEKNKAPWATDLPEYVTLADADPAQAVEIFKTPHLERWVRGALDRPDLAAQIHKLRTTHANDPKAGWKACREMLVSSDPPAARGVRAVTEAVQAGGTPAGTPQLPAGVKSAAEEGKLLSATLTAAQANGIRTGQVVAGANAPAADEWNAAVLDLLARGLGKPSGTTVTAAVEAAVARHIQADPAAVESAIRTAVKDGILKHLLDGLKLAVLRLADPATADPPGADPLVLAFATDAKPLALAVQELIDRRVPKVKPAKDAELVQQLGTFAGDNGNDLGQQITTRLTSTETRLRSELTRGFKIPLGDDPRSK